MKTPFAIRLNDEQRAFLEGRRKVLGLRSEADVVRAWIDAAMKYQVASAEVSATITASLDRLYEPDPDQNFTGLLNDPSLGHHGPKARDRK